MYAVFEDGSRQYRVQEGDLVQLDYRASEVGATIEFPRVLIAGEGAGVAIGQPLLAGARVVAEVVDFPTIKVTIQKFRRRKNFKRLNGHRQPYTRVRITQIVGA